MWERMQDEVKEQYHISYTACAQAGLPHYEAKSRGFISAQNVKKYYDDNFRRLVREELEKNETPTEDLIDFTEWVEPVVAVEVKDNDGPCAEAYICE